MEPWTSREVRILATEIAEHLSKRDTQLEAANTEIVRLREQVAALTAELAELSADHMALVERTADW